MIKDRKLRYIRNLLNGISKLRNYYVHIEVVDSDYNEIMNIEFNGNENR